MTWLASWAVVGAVVLVIGARHLLLDLAVDVIRRARRRWARPEGITERRRAGADLHLVDGVSRGWVGAGNSSRLDHQARAAGGGARPAPRRAA